MLYPKHNGWCTCIKNILNKKILVIFMLSKFVKNRTCVLLALCQGQGIIVKLFIVRNRGRVLGPQRHTSTIKYGEYPLSPGFFPSFDYTGTYIYALPLRVWFSCQFCLEKGIHFAWEVWQRVEFSQSICGPFKTVFWILILLWDFCCRLSHPKFQNIKDIN